MLPYWETRPSVPWPDIPLNHNILTLSQPVLALLVIGLTRPWVSNPRSPARETRALLIQPLHPVLDKKIHSILAVGGEEQPYTKNGETIIMEEEVESLVPPSNG